MTSDRLPLKKNPVHDGGYTKRKKADAQSIVAVVAWCERGLLSLPLTVKRSLNFDMQAFLIVSFPGELSWFSSRRFRGSDNTVTYIKAIPYIPAGFL